MYMKSKIILWAVLFISYAAISMEQSDQEALAQNKAKLTELIFTAQKKVQPFLATSRMTAEESTDLVQLTARIEQETQTLDLLIKKIRALHSSKNPVPKTYFRKTFGDLETIAKGAKSSSNWGICYKNDVAAKYSIVISSLNHTLWKADKLFILDPSCEITPIKWADVTTADIHGRPNGGYIKLIGEFDSGKKIAFIKFDEGAEEHARFKYRSRAFCEENNLLI